MMINRLLNGGIKRAGDQSLLSLLEDVARSERGNPNSARLAMYLVEYQRNKT